MQWKRFADEKPPTNTRILLAWLDKPYFDVGRYFVYDNLPGYIAGDDSEFDGWEDIPTHWALVTLPQE